MPRGWAILLWIVALGCLGGGVWAWWHATGTTELAPGTPLTPTPGVSLQLKKVRIFGVSDGKIIWEVEADHFDIDKNQPLTRMTGLRRVAVLDAQKHEDLTLSADYLERNNITNDITLMGKVTVSGPQMLFHTDEVNWVATGNQLLLSRPLTAQVGDYTLTAQGPTTYDVSSGALVTNNALQLVSGENVLHATAASVLTREQQFSLTGPGTAELVVADMEGWMNGQPLPKIPEIPADIRKRYAAYQKSHAPWSPAGIRPQGGFRP